LNIDKSTKAIIWDYDGTLVDTGPKNLNVTRRIVKKVTGNDYDIYPAIQNLEQYLASHRVSINWRDYYKKEFGISEEDIDEAGRLWTGFQLEDDTEVPLFNGIKSVVHELKDIPHGVVSQNSHTVIKNTLRDNDLLTYFGSIIGYEEVALNRQKPVADGLLLCIKELTGNRPGIVYYIGDHETDSACVYNTNNELKKKSIEILIKSIGIFYNGNSEVEKWKYQPDYKIISPEEILKIINKKDV